MSKDGRDVSECRGKGCKKASITAIPRQQRGNQRKGKGTMANDRPPIVGTVGRSSGQIRLKVCDNTQQITIQPQVESTIKIHAG